MGIFAKKYPDWEKLIQKGDVKKLIEGLDLAGKFSNSPCCDVAVDALVKIGVPAVDLLISAVKNPNKRIRAGACLALGRIQDGRVFEPLIAAFDDPVSDVVRSAIQALGTLRDPRAVSPLIDKLARYPDVAAEALENLGDTAAVEPLIQAIPAWKNQYSAMVIFNALAGVGDSRAIQPLLDVVYNPQWDFTSILSAAHALERLRSKFPNWQSPENKAIVLGLSRFHKIYKEGMSESQYKRNIKELDCQHNFVNWKHWDISEWQGNTNWASVNDIYMCTKCRKMLYGEEYLAAYHNIK